jgi:hypothetical protein
VQNVWAELRDARDEMGLPDSLRLIGKHRQACFLANALRLELEEGAPRFSS